MFGQDQPEVLVVGAGPVGLLTALRLAEEGVRVRIIDEGWQTGTRSYACALHPHALKLLDQVGLAAAVIERGHRINTIGFYDGQCRHAEMRLAELSVDYPFIVVLPQSTLEELLEQRLKQRWGVKVYWNHRLSDLDATRQPPVATLDKLEGTVTGYSVPTWEWAVKKQYEARPTFIVGADGRESLVRRRLGIEYERFGPPETYGVYEFEVEGKLEPEVRIVLGETTTSVLWPLAADRCRWSFQLGPGAVAEDYPAKERRVWQCCDEAVDRILAQDLQTHIRERAPWFTSPVKELAWSIEVAFAPRLATQFGRGPCWLAGDAAHQTGPAGVQSMNAGFAEAAALAAGFRKILRERAALELLDRYPRSQRLEWQWLLGLRGGWRTGPRADPWIRQRCARMRACVPALGDDLTHLLRQVGIERTEETTV